jgi:hypothetical protein
MSAVSLSDPQSLNLYAYCGNDPINHTDPDGLDGGVSTVIIVVQVVSAVIGAIRAIFGGGGRAAAKMGAKVERRFYQETASSSVWVQPSIRAGVGAVSVYLSNQEKGKEPPLGPDGKPIKVTIPGPDGKRVEVKTAPPETRTRVGFPDNPPGVKINQESVRLPANATFGMKARFVAFKVLDALRRYVKPLDSEPVFINPRVYCQFDPGLPWCTKKGGIPDMTL